MFNQLLFEEIIDLALVEAVCAHALTEVRVRCDGHAWFRAAANAVIRHPFRILLVFDQFHGQFPLVVGPVGLLGDLHAGSDDCWVSRFAGGDEIDPAPCWVFVVLEGGKAVWGLTLGGSHLEK